MKEYFISEILINKLYHLSNIKIELNPTERQHLLLTGKNGSGKTSLLVEIEAYLKAIEFEQFDWLKEYNHKISVTLNEYDGPEQAYQAYVNGEFITAYFPAERKAKFVVPNGVENIQLHRLYPVKRPQ